MDVKYSFSAIYFQLILAHKIVGPITKTEVYTFVIHIRSFTCILTNLQQKQCSHSDKHANLSLFGIRLFEQCVMNEKM